MPKQFSPLFSPAEFLIPDVKLQNGISFEGKDVYDIIPLFLYDRTQNSNEDGYNIVKEYLDSDYMRTKTLRDKIGKSATSDLIKKR